MIDVEQIVFVDDAGKPTGFVGPKLASHTATTKLHLAFSCYILRRSDSAFLLTQRALSKRVWPGVWTNSVCGHPGPNEIMEDAIRRRASFELGIENLDNIRCLLPSYRYITPPYKGIIENEFCPVFVAYTNDEPNPNSSEVALYNWLTWTDYTHFLNTSADKMSYWAKDQYKQIKSLEPFVSLK